MTDHPLAGGDAPPRRHRFQWFMDIVTDDSGKTFTPDKVCMIAGVAVYFGLAIYDVVHNKTPFLPNAMAFGTGLGAVLAAGGGAMWLASRQASGGGQ
jgi:hypothetical protein